MQVVIRGLTCPPHPHLMQVLIQGLTDLRLVLVQHPEQIPQLLLPVAPGQGLVRAEPSTDLGHDLEWNGNRQCPDYKDGNFISSLHNLIQGQS